MSDREDTEEPAPRETAMGLLEPGPRVGDAGAGRHLGRARSGVSCPHPFPLLISVEQRGLCRHGGFPRRPCPWAQVSRGVVAGRPSSLRGGPPVIPRGPHAGSLLTPSPVLIKSHIYVSPVCMESPSPPTAWAGAAAPAIPGRLPPPLAAPQGPELLLSSRVPHPGGWPSWAGSHWRKTPGPCCAFVQWGGGAQPCSRACVPGSPSARVGRGRPCLQDHVTTEGRDSVLPRAPLPVPRTGLHADAPAALRVLSLDAGLAEGSRVLPGDGWAQKSRLSRCVCW